MTYLIAHFGDVVGDAGVHLEIVFASLALALAVAVPLGVLAVRVAWLRGPALGALGVIYSIPSMALFGVLVIVLGLGFWTAVLALAAYAQMILVRNIAAGIDGVDRAVVEAARGSGMSPWQVFWRVERPLAMPVALAGMRVATVSVIGIACVAAWIGAGGLGTLIFAGIDQENIPKAVAGALAAVVLALAADGLWRLLESRYRRHVA
jgi:osmoprotectant transport system permease protein